MNDLEQALRGLSARAGEYRLFRDYYEGRHNLRFATEKWWSAFGHLFRAFADNLCPSVVDAVADRLELTGFGVETGQAATGDAAWKLWQRNRMDLHAGQVHLEALKAGDSYVIVWPDPKGKATLYPQKAALMTAKYDEEQPGRMLWAAKGWITEEKYARVTLYYPDRLEKYVSRQKAPNGTPMKASAYVPYPKEPRVPNQWGVVPVFHFANNAAPGDCGDSELRNVVPLQDALNKSVLDMLITMEFHSYPQRWATGLEAEVDEETGKPKSPFIPGTDRIWFGDEDVKFGQFDPASLEQFLKVSDSFRMEIARVSGTPLHYIMLLGGTPPSGEALKTLEARLVKKCKDRQAGYGNAWEDALALALRIENQAAEETRLSSQWKDPAPQSEKEKADTALVKEQVGVSKRQALKEMGYTDQQVTDMETERKAEAPPVPPSVAPPGARPGLPPGAVPL